ncbi:MAG: hypothetical protein R3B89_14915 [Polyangiaceae bacterium]
MSAGFSLELLGATTAQEEPAPVSPQRYAWASSLRLLASAGKLLQPSTPAIGAA